MAQNSKNKPNIFLYSDDITYMRDLFSFLKKNRSDFSIRNLAKKAQIATGYLPMCLSRKRVLSLEALDKIIPHLPISLDEKKALKLYRQIELTEKIDERSELLRKLQRLQSYRENNQPESEVFRYLTSWLNLTILELARSPNFKNEIPWIQSQLKFTATQLEIEKSIATLVKIGFVKISKNGKWKIKDKLLNCNEGVYKISLGEFHRQILDLIESAIATQNREERLILGHTLALSAKSEQLAREILNKAQKELEQLGIEETNPDRVLHFELCGITMAKYKE